MVSATLALVGFFVALYLWLWKVGLLGALACGDGGCETVQLSEHAVFLGIPVALYGVAGYLAILATSLWGLHGRWATRREPTVVLVVLAGIGLAFTGYLTYLEAAVIDAWCRWCLVSAAIIVAIFVTSVVGMVRSRMVSDGVGW
ncbi:MAG: vitamin K epoxide reductase family protein [Gemmatimonadetes bacterium]|nr:vitamin K epoxide reductase family protein [Gemmatimonadota bacterium]